ncbi:MAG: response regulator transcription factor [Bacteroidales bacterium]
MLKEKPHRTIPVAIVEPSEMLREGLCVLLGKNRLRHEVLFINLENLPQLCIRKSHTVAIINPILIINQIRQFQYLKDMCPRVAWIALQYMYFDQQVLELFNEVITLHDTPEKLAAKLKRVYENIENPRTAEQTNTLSDRETEVLLHLASGRSNKEIADILNISVNTVITHRKNITQKTGIKTVSGLTIYALSQGLIKHNFLSKE